MPTNKPPTNAAEVLAAQSPELRAAREETKRGAILAEIEALVSKQAHATEYLRRELEARPHLDVESSSAEREAAAEARGFERGYRTAAQQIEALVERLRRGGA